MYHHRIRDLLQQMHVCTVYVLGFPEGEDHAAVIAAAEGLCNQHGQVHRACCYVNRQKRPFALVKMTTAEAAAKAVEVIASSDLSPCRSGAAVIAWNCSDELPEIWQS